MGPVQGRFVSSVFAAHDATVWVVFGGAADAAAGRNDDAQPAAKDDAGGGTHIVANLIVAVTVGASDGAGEGGVACI
jgi:hypothetical protein